MKSDRGEGTGSVVKWIAVLLCILFAVWVADASLGLGIFSSVGRSALSVSRPGPPTSSDNGGFGGGTEILAILVAMILLGAWKMRSAPSGGELEIIKRGPPAPPGRAPGPISDVGGNPEPPEAPRMTDPLDPPTRADPRYKPKRVDVPEDKRLIIEDIEKWFLGVRNQDNLGACAAFAATSIFEYNYNRKQGKVGNNAKRSELFLWYNARRGKEQDSGTYIHDLVRELKTSGNCDYKLWTFEDDSTRKYLMRPPDPAYASGLLHCVRSCRVLPNDPDDWIGALAEGLPIFIAARIPTNFPRGKIKASSFDETPRFGKPYSGHAMVIVGYDSHHTGGRTKDEYFKVRNSWGTGWGEGGYLWIKRSVLEEIVSEGSGAWVFIGQIANKKPPEKAKKAVKEKPVKKKEIKKAEGEKAPKKKSKKANK